MAKTSAHENELGELHAQIARVMRKALQSIEVRQDLDTDTDEDQPTEVNPALLSVITRFLSENKITCIPAESADLTEIQKTIDARRKRLIDRKKTVQVVGNVAHIIDED